MTITLLSLLVVILSIATYIVRNLLKKMETLEDNIEELVKNITEYDTFYDELKRRVNESNSRLKQIDRLGSFEADDETGVIFKELKDIVNDLNERF
jgi:cell division protein FtsL